MANPDSRATLVTLVQLVLIGVASAAFGYMVGADDTRPLVVMAAVLPAVLVALVPIVGASRREG